MIHIDGGKPPKEILDSYHLHELLDRIAVARHMWEDIVQGHPACDVFIKEMAEQVQDAMGECYQKMGGVIFDEDVK